MGMYWMQDPPRGGKGWIDAETDKGKQLKAGLTLADKKMEQALKDIDDLLKEPGKHPAAEQRFKDGFKGDASEKRLKQVKGNIEKMIKAKHQNDGKKFSDSSQSGYNRADAYPDGPRGGGPNWQIVLLANFWDVPAECFDSQSSILIHELSHVAFGSGDQNPYAGTGKELTADEKQKQLAAWAKAQGEYKSPFRPEDKSESAQKSREKDEQEHHDRPFNEADCYKFYIDNCYEAANPKPPEKK
jgi:hypothetical protein